MWRLVVICVSLFGSPALGRLTARAVPDSHIELANGYRDHCLGKLGLTMDDYEKFDYNGDHNTMCYISCVFQQGEWMAEDGQFVYEKMEAIDLPEVVEQLKLYKANCPLQPDGDVCEKGYNFILCYKKYNPDFYFP